jgi:hypothetical protein
MGVSGFAVLIGVVIVLMGNAMRLNTRLYEKVITIVAAVTVGHLAEHLLRVVTGDGVSEVPLMEYLLPAVTLHSVLVGVFLIVAREMKGRGGTAASVRL